MTVIPNVVLFAVPIDLDGEQWHAVSNGYFAIFRRGTQPDSIAGRRIDTIGGFVEILRGAIASELASVDRERISALRIEPNAACTRCDGGGTLPCDSCAETGVFGCTCNCGHEHEATCTDCGGNGEVECPCVTDGIALSGSKAPCLVVGIGAFDRRLITLVLDELKDGDLFAGKLQGKELIVFRDASAYAVIAIHHIGFTDKPKTFDIFAHEVSA